MAAAELNTRGTTTACRRPPGVRRTVALTYLGLWAVMLTAAITTSALDLTDPVRGALGLRLSPSATPAPTLRAVATLALHNLTICGWPLLLPDAGASRSRAATLAAHALVAGSLAANAALVGAALGAYGPGLVAYTPQLPIEWLALAAGAAGWLTCRNRCDRRSRLMIASLVLTAVLAAASLETYATPHTPSSRRTAAAAKREGAKHAP
jgi:hypothetical protein